MCEGWPQLGQRLRGMQSDGTIVLSIGIQSQTCVFVIMVMSPAEFVWFCQFGE